MRCSLKAQGEDGHTSIVSAIMMTCVEGNRAVRSHLYAVTEGFKGESKREGLHGEACG